MFTGSMRICGWGTSRTFQTLTQGETIEVLQENLAVHRGKTAKCGTGRQAWARVGLVDREHVVGLVGARVDVECGRPTPAL